MSFLLNFLGVILGIICAFSIIALIIYKKISKAVGKQNMKELSKAIKNSSNIKIAAYQSEKNVSGMTQLLEPVILEDFHEFNKDQLFSQNEKNIRKILYSIENKSMSEIKNNQEMILMEDTIEKIIEDYRDAKINVEYNDIKFHRHAIKDYRKEQGKATVTLSTTMEYYFITNQKNIEFYKDIKKQTRYTTKYIYVYDEAKFKDNQLQFGIHCPNCGAPVNGTKNTVCSYCSSPVIAINLKAWKMIFYKEDYK